MAKKSREINDATETVLKLKKLLERDLQEAEKLELPEATKRYRAQVALCDQALGVLGVSRRAREDNE